MFGFVRKAVVVAAQEALHRAINMQLETYVKLGQAMGETTALKNENAQLRATQEWMKLRLNHVELERAQLISAAIGVKVSIPEFLPAPASDPARALSEMPDISTVGGDAHDDEPEGRPTMETPVDYSMLPGYRAPKDK